MEDEYRTYPMPINEFTEARRKIFSEIKGTEKYKFSRSCKHCEDTADSFNRYVSTYCHLKQERIYWSPKEDKLAECRSCPNYERRETR